MFSLFNFEINLKGISFPFFFRKKITKDNANILFIDDEVFPVVENLQKANWNVKRIKDLKNPQDEEVKKANIIFVDYKGVGKTLSEAEEGIGIIRLLKDTYKNSKRVILYSGYGRFSLSPSLDIADGKISKESSTYEFISMIESELKKIK